MKISGFEFKDYFLDYIASIPLIIATAFIILIVYHFISGKIFFSDYVRITKFKKDKYFSYSINTLKLGKVDLIDTTVTCRLGIQDISKTNAQIWNFYEIPTTFSSSLNIGKGFRIIHLSLYDAAISKPGCNIYFDKHIMINQPDCGLRFEDVFTSYENSYVRVYILGHDKFTGIKKLYVSKKYRFRDFHVGRWPKRTPGTFFKRNLKLNLYWLSKYTTRK